MENYLTNTEKSVAYFLLKSLFVLGSIFVICISSLMCKDALAFNNSFYKMITIIATTVISLITVLSSVCLYKKIK